jgi:hypothetical protein
VDGRWRCKDPSQRSKEMSPSSKIQGKSTRESWCCYRGKESRSGWVERWLAGGEWWRGEAQCSSKKGRFHHRVGRLLYAEEEGGGGGHPC